MKITIQNYCGGRDSEIADLILSIQNGEAGLSLTVEEQPDLLDIPAAYATGGFWVALNDDVIIGSIGLIAYGSRGVLKKFFVAAAYCGQQGPAAALLQRLLARARELGMTDIVLDTPSAATRSHAFYAKSGFTPISAKELLEGYTYPDRDSLLLRLRLSA